VAQQHEGEHGREFYNSRLRTKRPNPALSFLLENYNWLLLLAAIVSFVAVLRGGPLPHERDMPAQGIE
jgi:hypothetical protein